MAKRGTLDHPKTKRLARALGLPGWAALGLLEAVWHWCGRYAPTGALTVDDMEDLADTIRFDGGGKNLATILHGAGCLDVSGDGWYIHDWHDHADDTTKKALEKRGERFANGSDVRNHIDSRAVRESFANETPLPEPSLAKPETKPNKGMRPLGGVGGNLGGDADAPWPSRLFDSLPGSHQTPEVRDAIERFAIHRKERNLPAYKGAALIGLVKKLSGWAPSVIVEAVDDCLAHNWQGLFEPKPKNGKAPVSILEGVGQSAERVRQRRAGNAE